jgi:hypothetical protein
MPKLVGSICAAIILLLPAISAREQFAKYKKVEAYEIRPGILMMPEYSSNGLVCEIGLERRHYSHEKIDLDSTLSRTLIDQIADELVPATERGSRIKELGAGNLIERLGNSITTNTEYENVSIQIYSDDSPASGQNGITVDDVVATIKWKNRKCQ